MKTIDEMIACEDRQVKSNELCVKAQEFMLYNNLLCNNGVIDNQMHDDISIFIEQWFLRKESES